MRCTARNASQHGISPRRVCHSLQGENVDLLVELGYQLSLSGAFDAAVEAYQAGARANEGDVRAMTGVVYCQVGSSGYSSFSSLAKALLNELKLRIHTWYMTLLLLLCF